MKYGCDHGAAKSQNHNGIRSKRGQVGIYVVVAILIVAMIILFFVVREQIGAGSVPPEIEDVYGYYQSCISSKTRDAVQIIGAQGGRIDSGEYVPGSDYAPFSSHLNFLGFPVPYWYYVTGNGFIREQIPSKAEMQQEIETYLEENLGDCDFEVFGEGYVITQEGADASVEILDDVLNVRVDNEMFVASGESAARKSVHEVSLSSKLGTFYDLAKEIYVKEKADSFLESYAIDTLYSYAPVDGVEIQCGPKVWSTQNVMNDLKEGLVNNFQTIKLSGDYYTLSNEERKYFVVDLPSEEAVRFVYSNDWPTKVDISGEGVDDEVMIAEEFGTQEGLGLMGFCYVPYHFVYDVSFPVMVQIYDGDELFQFPVIVVVDNNVARQAIIGDVPFPQDDFDLCEFRTQDVEINVYDINLNSVDANISYECFNQKCRLGQSEDGVYRGSAPSCVNGYLHLTSGGYAEKKVLFSSNSESSTDVVVDREFDVSVDLSVGGRANIGSAIISFVRDDGTSATASLPDFSDVKLSEGNYEIRVYVYSNTSVTIPASTKYECVDVPEGGILGFFGGTEEQCFDVTVPATKLDYALVGGGVTNTYILEDELRKGTLHLSVERFKSPTSIDEMANNFELLSTGSVGVRFDED